MLDIEEITRIAGGIARKELPTAVERVFTEHTTDMQGNDALRIVVVVKPRAVRKITGDQALDFLVGLRRKFDEEGEERFPIVEYATEQELAANDDAE
jgi:hypothetical protein